MQLKTITNTNEFTSTDIIEIIDDHFMNETSLLFVCDKQLAEFIYNYVVDTYDVNNKYEEYNYDNEESLKDNLDQYYVSVYFSNDEDSSAIFFVESAKGNGEVYKLHDNEDEYINFYICIKMDEDIVFDKLLGENACWSWVKVDMDDIEEFNECNEFESDKESKEVACDDNCEDCEIPEDVCRDINIVDEYADKIENAECLCDGCLRNILYDLLMTGNNIGWDDHKEMLIHALSDD